MIPSDLAVRLRLLAESQVNPVAPVREIPAELPELPVGQRFAARIESALPDGTFRALVAGRNLTLALEHPAKPGDTLDLVVTERTPRLVLARFSEAASPQQSPPASLSRAGQLISTLLSGSEPAPRPATLAGTAPLLPAAPPLAAQLAPALQQAITESGLFYEAHQAQWIAGRLPVETLMREPQARLDRQTRLPGNAAAHSAATTAPAPDMAEASTARLRDSAPAMSVLPTELQPLVQQQLDAAATQQIVWRGEVWPGQTLHWEIEAEDRPEGQSEDATAAAWTTALRLELPHLGEVNAVLRLSGEKVSLAMTANRAHAGDLKQGLGELAAAFGAAGLPPLVAQVDIHEPA